jgi:hypothetical protein
MEMRQPCLIGVEEGMLKQYPEGRHFGQFYEHESLTGKYDAFTMVLLTLQQNRTIAVENAHNNSSHTSGSAQTHRNTGYELLMVTSIRKEDTQKYPKIRQKTISAFVQGIPILSWTIKYVETTACSSRMEMPKSIYILTGAK